MFNSINAGDVRRGEVCRKKARTYVEDGTDISEKIFSRRKAADPRSRRIGGYVRLRLPTSYDSAHLDFLLFALLLLLLFLLLLLLSSH